MYVIFNALFDLSLYNCQKYDIISLDDWGQQIYGITIVPVALTFFFFFSKVIIDTFIALSQCTQIKSYTFFIDKSFKSNPQVPLKEVLQDRLDDHMLFLQTKAILPPLSRYQAVLELCNEENDLKYLKKHSFYWKTNLHWNWIFHLAHVNFKKGRGWTNSFNFLFLFC